MDKRIDPDLFARLMTLSSDTRADLLEFIGQTPLTADEIRRLSYAAPANSPKQTPQP